MWCLVRRADRSCSITGNSSVSFGQIDGRSKSSVGSPQQGFGCPQITPFKQEDRHLHAPVCAHKGLVDLWLALA